MTVHPELVNSWSQNNVQTPDSILPTSSVRLLWICPDCDGEYGATIDERLNKADVCPYCSGRRVLPGFNDLATVHPELVSSWSQNNVQTPDSVLPTSLVRWLWICPDCDGEYGATIDERMNKADVSPYCSGRRVLPGFNSLDVTHPDLLRQWMYAGNLLLGLMPNKVFWKTRSNAWWKCPDCGYQYMLSVYMKCEKTTGI